MFHNIHYQRAGGAGSIAKYISCIFCFKMFAKLVYYTK